jgi:hypothetical protein
MNRVRACSPEWRGAHLIARRRTVILHDAVAGADVVQQKVAEGLDAFVARRAGDEHRAAVDRRLWLRVVVIERVWQT